MKKGLVILAFAFGLLMVVISVWRAIDFEVGKVTGKYIAVDARVTFVHEYTKRADKSFGTIENNRANGYFAWEYDGVMHDAQNERSSKIDLTYGVKEGDMISIWIKSSNGKFEAVNNKYTDRSLILLAIAMPAFWGMCVYSYYRIKSGKADKNYLVH